MSLPTFSVIIPAHNRPDRLAACLGALSALDYPRDRYEVIVVDDGSLRPLDTATRPFEAALDLTLLRQENAGPASARNTGAEQARGRYLAFTDDDCEPTPAWLRVYAHSFERTPQALVGGHVVNALPHNPYSEASQLLVSYLYAYADRRPSARFFTSNNFALSAEGFHDIGGFDPAFGLAAGEDRDFCDRWQRTGREMRFAPEAVVHHAHALTLRTFMQQHLHYGRGAYFFHRFKAGRGGLGLRPDLSFYAGLFRFPFSQSSRARGAWLASLLLLTQVSNAVGFFYAAFTRAWTERKRDGVETTLSHPTAPP
ncbi:MAG: glycosyltransferase [Rhodothermales bacterium]|nr:glycosyltransferase [Rhodothermales bacterium]